MCLDVGTDVLWWDAADTDGVTSSLYVMIHPPSIVMLRSLPVFHSVLVGSRQIEQYLNGVLSNASVSGRQSLIYG